MTNVKKSGSMTSKERVIRTFTHEKVDRVPFNYFGNLDINKRLIDYFGLEKNDVNGLLEALGVDFRGVHAPYTGPRLHEQAPDIIVDPQWGMRSKWIEHSTGGYYDICEYPLKDADEEKIANWPMPSPDDYNYKAVVEQCEHNKELAIFAGGGGEPDIINGTLRLRSMEQVLIDLVTDDPAGLLLIDRRLNTILEVMERTLDAAKGKIDFMWIGEDLGTQISPMISMELFRKHIRPRHQKYIDLAKAYDLPVMIHCCGYSSWAFEDFIEMGINAVDTLQPEAKNMSPKYLKDNFGGKLAFHGCISTAGPLAYGTVDDVIANVKETLEIMMPGGGYCMAPTHSIQDNTPTENVIAMYEAGRKHGTY